MKLVTIFAAACCLLSVGCAKKTAAVATPPPPVQAQSAPSAAPASGPAMVNREQPRATAPAPAASRYPDAATRARIDELLARIQDAYFDYDRHTLRQDAVSTLNSDSRELAQILNQYPDYKIRIEGYCDERGSAEYNIALGEARAKSAKDYLVSVGVSGNQLSTVSYGKETQVCDEHNESCWSKNRRVHIIAMK